MTVRMTPAQERRRRLAFRLDDHYVPDWINRILCRVVGRGHTPIHNYGIQCAWCEAKMSADAPDTMPNDWAPTIVADSGCEHPGCDEDTLPDGYYCAEHDNYDPTDEEQGPLEQGWAASRQYDLDHRED